MEGGALYLQPENPAYPPIREAFVVIGRVVGLLRRYGREALP